MRSNRDPIVALLRAAFARLAGVRNRWEPVTLPSGRVVQLIHIDGGAGEWPPVVDAAWGRLEKSGEWGIVHDFDDGDWRVFANGQKYPAYSEEEAVQTIARLAVG